MFLRRHCRAYYCSVALLSSSSSSSFANHRFGSVATAFVLSPSNNHHHHNPHSLPLSLSSTRITNRSRSTTSSGSNLFMSSPTTATTATTENDDQEGNNSSSRLPVDHVAINLQELKDSIAQVCEEVGRDIGSLRLVAVSKTKPLEFLEAAYDAGQRVFGENYVQELVDKAPAMMKWTRMIKDDASSSSPSSSDNVDTAIQWHFIGSLQSNKAAMLVKGVIPYGTLIVETVASLKVAKKLDNAMAEIMEKVKDDPTTTMMAKTLPIFIQINTSGEDSKSGIEPAEAIELCQQIVQECQYVTLRGVMTIGAPGDLSCLDTLVECRNSIAQAMEIDPNTLEVSMGMSDDYADAIRRGSTNIRVGSTIFGARDYSSKA